MSQEIPIRIVVLRPPSGVRFALQSGKTDLLPPTQETRDVLTFEVRVRTGAPRLDGGPDLMPPLAHGPPDDRFFYVNSGTLAGQSDSCWTRRAKIKTVGIDRTLTEEAASTPGAFLEARVEGTSRDGGPCCATVPLLEGGWRVVRPPLA